MVVVGVMGVMVGCGVGVGVVVVGVMGVMVC